MVAVAIAPESVEGAEWEKARRVRKQLRNGVRDLEELTAEEWGLLYLWFPEALPDVEEGVRA